MADTDSFHELVAKARTGDSAAMTELTQRYESEVRTVARLRLGPALRPYLDSIDLVQSVHRSLMMGLRDDRYQFNGPKDLVALVVTIVRRKAARQWQRVRRQERDSGLGRPEDLPSLIQNLSSPDEDPAEAASYRDTVRALCEKLDPIEKQLLELHLQGYRTIDIAEILNMNADVLRVKFSRLRAKLRASGIAIEI